MNHDIHWIRTSQFSSASFRLLFWRLEAHGSTKHIQTDNNTNKIANKSDKLSQCKYNGIRDKMIVPTFIHLSIVCFSFIHAIGNVINKWRIYNDNFLLYYFWWYRTIRMGWGNVKTILRVKWHINDSNHQIVYSL